MIHNEKLYNYQFQKIILNNKFIKNKKNTIPIILQKKDKINK